MRDARALYVPSFLLSPVCNPRTFLCVIPSRKMSAHTLKKKITPWGEVWGGCPPTHVFFPFITQSSFITKGDIKNGNLQTKTPYREEVPRVFDTREKLSPVKKGFFHKSCSQRGSGRMTSIPSVVQRLWPILSADPRFPKRVLR